MMILTTSISLRIIAALSLSIAFMSSSFAKSNVGVVNCNNDILTDRQAIQDALDNANYNTVELLGTCQLDGQRITINRSDLVLTGKRGLNGEYLTILKGLEQNCNNSVCPPLDQDPNGKFSNFFNRGIELGPVTKVTIKDLHMRSHKRTIDISPELVGSTSNLCEDTVVSLGATATNITVQNSLFTNSARGPQTFGSVDKISFLNNEIADLSGGFGFERSGFVIGGGSVGCFCDEGDSLDGLTGGPECVPDPSTPGEYLVGSGFDLGSASKVKIENNNIHDNFEFGIEIVSCEKCNIKSNHIENGLFAGLLLERDGTKSIVQGNTLVNTGYLPDIGFCPGVTSPTTTAITLGLCFLDAPTKNWTIINNRITSGFTDIPDVLLSITSENNQYIYNDADQNILDEGVNNQVILKD